MATDKRQFTMRMQPENYDKLRVIAAANKRSAAMQLEYLLEQSINEYETRYGVIHLQDSANGNVIHQSNQNGDNILSVSG